MLDQETIHQLLARLEVLRKLLAIQFARMTTLGDLTDATDDWFNDWGNTTRELRQAIARIKTYLRENGIQVEDELDDEENAEMLGTDRRLKEVLSSHPEHSVGVVINDPPSNFYVLELCIDVAIPQVAVVNELFLLAVLVRTPNLPVLEETELDRLKTGEAEVIWPKDQPYISLRVKVLAPGCIIHDANQRSFRLYAKRASPVLYFSLVPRILGTISIIVDLYQEDDAIASTRVRTESYERPVGEVKIDIVAQKPSVFPQQFAASSVASDDDRAFNLLLFREKQRRLRVLELKKARKGNDSEPHIDIEIEDLWKEIAALKQQIS